MSEKSLIRWALRGYSVWQKLQKARRGFGRFLGGKKEAESTAEGTAAKPSIGDAAREAEDIDLENVFKQLAAEARDIQQMLTDPERTALNIVTLPERLPIEETIDLHAHAVAEIGIHIGVIFVNKVQPDALGAMEDRFFALLGDDIARQRLSDALAGAGYPAELADALCSSTEFSDLRRRMNLRYIAELETRLSDVPLVRLPLLKEDVEGIPKLKEFERIMFGSASPRLTRPAEPPV